MLNCSWRTATVALGLGAGLMLGAGRTQAATITWNLNSPTGVLGTSQTYTAGGITITAAGFTNNTFATGVNLFGKNDGGDEVGLGLNNDPSGEHEITGTNLVRIDFSNAKAAGVLPNSFDFKFNSTTGGEAWAVFGSNSATTGFTMIASGNDELEHFINPGAIDNFYYFEATDGNVLLNNVSGVTSAVPEPATWAMMLLGFAGLGFAFRQSRRKVSFA